MGENDRAGAGTSVLLSVSQEKGEIDDAKIIAGVLRGDAESFGLLVDRHEKRMINIAFRMIGSYEDACEVVQDSFVSAYRGLADFRGSAKFSTWLASIVMNLSRNRLRQLASHAGREAYSLDEPDDPDTARRPRDAASGLPSPLDEIERKETRKAIEDCIGRLESEFRETLVLRDIEGYSYIEIGGILNLAEGTVKSRISRARAAMKDCLKNHLGALNDELR